MTHGASSWSAYAMLVRMARRWVWAVAGGTAGACLVTLWASDVHEAHTQLRRQVQALKDAMPADNRPAVRAMATASGTQLSEAPALVERLPAVRDAVGLWLALQKGLQQQGLQVQALRPEALQEALPLSSQAVAVRLQGRFSDMANAWDALVDAGPVWTLDRLTVSIHGQAGQLQWDGVWRVWLRPGVASAQAWPALWDVSGRPSADRAASPFLTSGDVAQTPGGPSQGFAESAPLSADPRQWPLAQTRLLGVWQHGGRLQAVLAAGAHWAVLGPDAPVALEGYRIQTIHQDAVTLRPLQAPGGVHILRLQGVPP